MMTATKTPTGRVRSVPRLVFTDAEAGALEFPSSNSRSFNYFKPQRLKATMYEDVTGEVKRLALVPRSKPGVGADHLPKQRSAGAPGGAEHRLRAAGERLRALVAEVDGHRGQPHRRLDASRTWPGHARLPARPAGRPHEHAQQRHLGELDAQAAHRAGPRALQPRGQRGAFGLRWPRPSAGVERGSDLAACP